MSMDKIKLDNICKICPRECGVDRAISKGYCGETDKIRLGKVMLHMFEEPCISGIKGSGAVFFSGCSLRCRYCQNYEIVGGGKGKEVSILRLAEIFLELQQKGAHNINLVNPTHFVPWIAEALAIVKTKLNIPVVYNTGGYDSIASLRLLDGLVDIYLPDLKYYDTVRSLKYSNAKNYFQVASAAIKYMFDSVGSIKLNDNGIMNSGVIIRHLVLPKGHKDSMEIVQWIGDNFRRNEVFLSLMSQYTPYMINDEYPELNRKIYSYEYNKVAELAEILEIQGFMQDKKSAEQQYTPKFDFLGV